MPRLVDLRPSGLQQAGPHGFHLIGQLAPGKDKVQLAEQLIVPADGAGKLSRIGRKLRQDVFDLRLFLAVKDADIVIQLHHGGRLNKKRCAAGAGVMDHAGHATAVFRLHWHHEAAVALRDDGILKDLLVGLGGGDLVQHLPDLGGRRPDLAADLIKLGAGMVGDLFLGDDGVFDLLLQKFISVEQREIFVQRGLGLPALLPIILRQPCGPEHGTHA